MELNDRYIRFRVSLRCLLDSSEAILDQRVSLMENGALTSGYRFREETLVQLQVSWPEESGSLTDNNASQSATFIAFFSSYHHHHVARVLWSSSVSA